MRKVLSMVAVGILALACTPVSRADSFGGTGFVIRNGNDASIPPYSATATSIITSITAAGQKVGYGTSFFNGQSIRNVGSVSYTRNDAGSGEIYSNLWVTDGTHYALLSPRFVTPGDGYLSSTVNGVNLQSLGMGIYGSDYSDLTWLAPGATRTANANLFSGGVPLTLADLNASLTVGSPVFPGYAFAGSGDPKAGFGFQLIFGDTQGNHLNPVPYDIGDVSVTAVPEPASLAVLGVAGVGLLLRRRK